MHIDQFERYWLVAVAVVLGVFSAALFVSVVAFGVRLPSPVGRINPAEIQQTEFAQPGVRDMGNNRYTVHLVSQMWSFSPGEIRLPRGAEVTFIMTSRDVTHGLIIEQHDVNLMLLPGQIARTTTTFNRPGTYHMICHEYCGPGHQNMIGTIVVEE